MPMHVKTHELRGLGGSTRSLLDTLTLRQMKTRCAPHGVGETFGALVVSRDVNKPHCMVVEV